MNYRKVFDAVVLWPRRYRAKYGDTQAEKDYYRRVNILCFVAVPGVVVWLYFYG